MSEPTASRIVPGQRVRITGPSNIGVMPWFDIGVTGTVGLITPSGEARVTQDNGSDCCLFFPLSSLTPIDDEPEEGNALKIGDEYYIKCTFIGIEDHLPHVCIFDRDKRIDVDIAVANKDLIDISHPSSAGELVGVWRPIETAPKDGTAVIVAAVFGNKVTSVRMCVWNGLGWYEVYSGAGINFVTLWMPLPSVPPAPDGGKEGVR